MMFNKIQNRRSNVNNEDRDCKNCHYEKNLQYGVGIFPCNKCDPSDKPPEHWKDWRLFDRN